VAVEIRSMICDLESCVAILSPSIRGHDTINERRNSQELSAQLISDFPGILGVF
jgi:hypothetical protein